MSIRPCLTCGTLTTSSRCPAHTPNYGSAWRRLRAQAKRQHPHCQGPGPHAGRLEVDHVNPGRLDAGVRVLCAACHHRKTAGQTA